MILLPGHIVKLKFDKLSILRIEEEINYTMICSENSISSEIISFQTPTSSKAWQSKSIGMRNLVIFKLKERMISDSIMGGHFTHLAQSKREVNDSTKEVNSQRQWVPTEDEGERASNDGRFLSCLMVVTGAHMVCTGGGGIEFCTLSKIKSWLLHAQ